MKVDLEVKLARQFKKAGGSKDDYIRLRSEAMRKSAASQGWRRSELAATLADVSIIAGRVWK